jgi:hypothetical protein
MRRCDPQLLRRLSPAASVKRHGWGPYARPQMSMAGRKAGQSEGA